MLSDVLNRIKTNVEAYRTSCTCGPRPKTKCPSCESSLKAATDRADLYKIFIGLQEMMRELTDQFVTELRVAAESADMDLDLNKLAELYTALPEGQWRIQGSVKGAHAIERVYHTREINGPGEEHTAIVCRFQLKANSNDRTSAQPVDDRNNYGAFLVAAFNAFPKLFEMAELCIKMQEAIGRISNLLGGETPADVAIAEAKVIINDLGLKKAG